MENSTSGKVVTMIQILREMRICQEEWNSTETKAQLGCYVEEFQSIEVCFQPADTSILSLIYILSSSICVPIKL